MDYIYQGPIILVLLVGPQWGPGWGWAPGGRRGPTQQRCWGRMWPRVAPLHTVCTYHPTSWHPHSHSPYSMLHPLVQPPHLWPSGSSSGQRIGLTGRFLVPPTSDVPLPGTETARRGGG